MTEDTAAFYDALAADYHLIFDDWRAAVERQGAVLDALIRAETGRAGPLDLLDAAAGIGTQALGLAARGHRVTATDLSARALDRLRGEAVARGLQVPTAVADLRALEQALSGRFDVVLAVDNALPHLQDEDELARALRSMAGRLRPGGLLLASIRDYDAILADRPDGTPPRALDGPDGPRTVRQDWAWLDARRYRVHLHIEGGHAAESRHVVGIYRAVRRDELSRLCRAAGLARPRWQMPQDSGFYQPVLLANR